MTAGILRRHVSSAAGHDDPVEPSPSALGRADLVFAVMVGLAVLVRASHLVLDGAPVGVDGGNWLAFGNALLGGPARPEGVTYPPVVPLLTTAVVALLGPVGGVMAIGGVSAVAPAVAFYPVARRAVQGAAPLLAGTLLLTPATGAMAAWGGYPQLLGSALVVGGIWTLSGWLDNGDRSALLGTIAASTLVLATSHASAAVGCAAWGGVAAASLIRGGHVVRRRLLTAILLAAAAAAPLAPLYGRIVPALVSARHAEPAMAAISIGDLPARFVLVHGAAWPVWAAGCLLAITAVARDGGRTRLGVMTAGLLFGLPALFLMTGQPRVLHEIPLLAVTGVTLRVAQTRSGGLWRALMASSAVALVVVTAAGVADAPRQQMTYAVLDGDLLAAVGWIDRHTPHDATIAVSAVRGAPFGWWVEGLSQRRVIYAAPLRWLTFKAERDRARVANGLFHRVGLPTREGIRRAERLGVDYVLLTTDGPAHRPDAVRQWRQHVVFDNAAAVVIKIEKP